MRRKNGLVVYALNAALTYYYSTLKEPKKPFVLLPVLWYVHTNRLHLQFVTFFFDRIPPPTFLIPPN